MLRMFNLEEKNIKEFKVYHQDGILNIDITLNPKKECCNLCGHDAYTIKGYVNKKLLHSTFTNQKCVINYKARRYKCRLCNKTFYEHNPFAFDGMRLTMNTVYNVLCDLRKVTETFSSVAERYHLSPTSVVSIFDNYVDIGRSQFSEVICIDEVYAFKSYQGKYVCVLLDFKTQEIIDLLPSRKKADLYSYLRTIPKKERSKVKLISMDMWRTYRDVAQVFFPEAVCAVDKFHVLQEFSRKFSRVRVMEMNKYKKPEVENDATLTELQKEMMYRDEINYYLLKKFNWLLFKMGDKAPKPDARRRYNQRLKGHYNLYELRELIFKANPVLLEVFNIQSKLYKFYEGKYSEAEEKFNDFIEVLKKSNIHGMTDFMNTLLQWKREIINSFMEVDGKGKVTNAIIENRNKAIKTIKRNSNGYKNWNRFRNRVMYVVNKSATHYLYPIKSSS